MGWGQELARAQCSVCGAEPPFILLPGGLDLSPSCLLCPQAHNPLQLVILRLPPTLSYLHGFLPLLSISPLHHPTLACAHPPHPMPTHFIAVPTHT